MSGFLYFVPAGQPGLKPSDLPYLRDLLEDANAARCQVIGQGPDGGQGMVLADGRTVDRVGYYPAEQTWRTVPGAEPALWVGIYSASPPRPAELERSRLVAGTWVRLADEQNWLCPIALKRFEQPDGCPFVNALPTSADLTADGRWVAGRTLPRYRELFEVAQQFFRAILLTVIGATGDEVEQDQVLLDYPNVMPAAIECLRVNYRVGPAEMALLSALTIQTARDILRVATDLDLFIGWFQKKTTAGESSTAAGSPSSPGPAG